jgi:hypothetical protein
LTKVNLPITSLTLEHISPRLAMDAAYDHIQEESFMKEDELKPGDDTPTQSPTLNAEFQDAYNAVVNSPWGARLGGFWGTVKKAV